MLSARYFISIRQRSIAGLIHPNLKETILKELKKVFSNKRKWPVMD